MDRRFLLSIIAGTAVFPHLAKAVPLPPPQPHKLNLVNQHTGETFSGVYRDDNGPVQSAMDDLSVFLRDYHYDEKIAIDVGVIDFLTHVMQAVGQRTATIFSAYRTPATNEKLTHGGFGAAENSQHLYGRALDVHFGEKLEDAMRAARGMKRGGVGWYPHSGFMHIDTGPVRNWDLDHRGLGSLLVSRHRVHFDKQGDVLVDKRRLVGGRFPHLVRTDSVRGRLARLRQVARVEFAGRHH
jgi:uncharacterized protein YcbK (DUF882 family)